MGFLDKAKAAASDLAAKADSALSGTPSGGAPRPADVDKYFHDLGVLDYLQATGRAADAAERERVMAGLSELDSAGAIRSFALHTAAPPAPGMAGAVPPAPGMAGQVAPPPPGPGMAGQTPPPMPGGATPPPMPGTVSPMPGAAPAAPPAPGPAAPAAPVTPPPPPSWMTGGDDTKTT
jgi:hypothetical protein